MRRPRNLGLLSWARRQYDPAMKVDTRRLLAEEKLARLARDSSDNVLFWRDATETLRGVLPFDFHPCWFTVDPLTRLVNGHLNEGLDRTPPEIVQAWYAEGDVNSPGDLADRSSGVATVKLATGGDPMSSWRWRNLLQPRGFDDSLDAVLRRGKTVWGAINLLHTPESEPFTSKDLEFVSRISHVLATGTQLGLLRAESEVAGRRDGPVVLIVDADLVARSTTSNAEDVMADMPDIGSFRPDRLPIALQVIVLRALQSANGEASTMVRSVSGPWVRIQGTRLSSGGAPQVAVIVEEATPHDLAPVRLATYGLTARESEVVDLVLRGRSTRDIANELFISEYTVQDRLKAVFEKVGVRSRRDLVATIHASDYLPMISMNDDRLKHGQNMVTRPGAESP